jgi:phosphatidylserine decarboxylase
MIDTYAARPHRRSRRGGWLPHGEHALSHFRATLADHSRQRSCKVLSPPVQELCDLVMNTPILRMHLTEAIEQAIALEQTHPEVKLGYSTIAQLMLLIDSVMTMSLPFSTSELVACPINALLDWPMCVPAGFPLFQFPEINEKIKLVLCHWSAFLGSSDSRKYLNSVSPTGWFSKEAASFVDMSLFECSPGNPHHGFASWNDFFIRRFKPGVRPIAAPRDPAIIASACEAKPFHLQENVALQDSFWLKGQPYSLIDIFTAPRIDLAEKFAGGTVYQAFLSAYNYHRWHAPVAGIVVDAYMVPGTYYSDAPSAGLDTGGPDKSQGYITAVAARAVLVIDTGWSGLGLVACIFVGMGEVSSCVIEVCRGEQVDKGQEIGYFQFGGSTHCLIFQPVARIDFEVKPPFGDDTPTVKVGAHLATVGGRGRPQS